MQKVEDSFDGTFQENIRSAIYKNQFSTKKNKMIINVNGILSTIKKLSTQWSNTSPKRTNGSCRLNRYTISTLTSVGLTLMSSLNCSLACNPIKKSITSQVNILRCRYGNFVQKKQSGNWINAV